MLIQRGGILRDIDGNRLEEYRAKGYKAAAEEDPRTAEESSETALESATEAKPKGKKG